MAHAPFTYDAAEMNIRDGNNLNAVTSVSEPFVRCQVIPGGNRADSRDESRDDKNNGRKADTSYNFV